MNETKTSFKFEDTAWTMVIPSGLSVRIIIRGYPAKRVLSAMRKHGGKGHFGRIPSNYRICILIIILIRILILVLIIIIIIIIIFIFIIIIIIIIIIIPPPNEVGGGGGVLDSPCPSVRLSVCPSVCRRHGFRSISQVSFRISISNFICMLIVAIGRSLLIFSDVTCKMAAWRPYWIFWFPD